MNELGSMAKLLHSALDNNNVQYTLAWFGMILGAVIWMANRIFATNRNMDRCKNEIMVAFQRHRELDQKRVDAMLKVNDHRYEILDGKIDSIRDHLIKAGRV